MTKIFELTISRTGIPCLWEHGGGYSNTGESQIIAGKNGEAKQPIYIRRRGELACCKHALIPIAVGDYVISANHHRRDFETQICRVEEIQAETAVCSIIGEYSRGEWTGQVAKIDEEHHFLIPAVDAAWEKATCYHCREPHYVELNEE